ncbi:AAA family ATPase [Legionella brunensis]|uniref:Ankyrin repeat protein n=1 Tax=Legionella brunensis TaxID=29422 RepID=A0A0W0S1U8_9GAMM|nr:AAA family ATPase [Legionella brunensis]KTC76917.1 ankyrin repeat protein [Legionella brunensis]
MYPKEFYYLEKHSETYYGYTPTNNPHIGKLIKGQPYWRRNQLISDLKKKTIIFADWTSHGWSIQKTELVQKKIKELIKDGFDIYLKQDDKFILLNEETVSSLSQEEIKRKITLDYKETITSNALKQLQLTSDQIHVLDDYQIDCLLDTENASKPRNFYVNSQVWSMTFSNRKIYEPFLHPFNPPITTFVQQEFSSTSISYLQKQKKNFPEQSYAAQYRNLYLNSSEISTIINEGEISIEGESFTRNDLHEIERLQISEEEVMTASNLEWVLSHTPKLQHLELDAFSDLVTERFNDLHLSELASLSLRHNSISSNNLVKLISSTPNLRVLKLVRLTGSNPIPLQSISFPKLEVLNITRCKVPFLDLESLLSQTVNLRSLDLSDTEISTSNIEKKLDFPLLQEINFSGSNVSDFNIRKIVSAAPNLKSLRVSGYKDIFRDNSLSIQLDQLETLEISNSNLSLNDLENLLKRTPNLKNLKLTNCPNLKDGVLAAKLPNLLSLNLHQCHFSSIYNLLSSTPQLKQLSLSNCPDILQNFKQTDLRVLSEIQLTNCSVSPSSLQQLLSSSTLINHLSLNDERNDSFAELLQNNHLDVLESADFSDLPVTIEQLKQFLYKATNLKTIRLTHLVEPDEELRGQLENIRVVGLPTSNVSGSTNNNSKSPATEFNQAYKTAQVDADTRLDPQKEFNFSRIFYPINPLNPLPAASHDRLNIFDSLKVTETSCPLSNAFLLKKELPLDLKTCAIEASSQDVFDLAKQLEEKLENSEELFYGKQKFRLNQEWQPIPSLAANETMTHYHVDPPDDTVEIQYSVSNNQYYIRSKNQGKEINLDFILKIPNQKTPLPDNIRVLVDYFNQEFRAGPLTYDKSLPTGQDYLRYLQEQRKGACRHRAVVFKAVMEEKFPEIPVRIITNQCHAFAEIKINEQWLRCDLGGYPAALNINEGNNPHRKTGDAVISRVVMNEISEQEKTFTKQLETWQKNKPAVTSLQAYCQQLVRIGADKKRLIEMPSDKAVESLQLALQSHCKNISRPIYYINSPEDLVCSAPFVKREGIKGVLQKGPGGPLHDFLIQYYDKSNPPVLLVNYANFNADDIVNFNGLLDEIRQADGTPLPQEALVIGLINPSKPDCYQGEDFYSRFDQVEICPLTKQTIEEALPESPVVEKTSDEKTFVIDLYHSADWEERLLGRWGIDKDDLYFQEGELQKALASNLPIEIKNGTWEDKKFTRLWQQIKIHKTITYANQKIDIPEKVQFFKTEGYPYLIPKMAPVFIPNAEVLNPTRLSQFFYQYQYNAQQQILEKRPGILESYAKKQLIVNLTRFLNDDEQAMLLLECKKHEVKMILRFNPAGEPISFNKSSLTKTEVITSTDVDTTVAQITQDSRDWQVIDVSECEAADLLFSIKGHLNKESLRFEFSETKQAVLTALAANKKVILKGRFSSELADLLAPLILERQNSGAEANGNLVIVSDGKNEEQFSYADPSKHEVSVADKKQQLALEFPSSLVDTLSDSLLEKESLSKLQARLAFQKKHPTSSTDDAWKGMLGLPAAIKLPEFDAIHSSEKAALFVEGRLTAVNDILDNSPYVFLTGLTAVGKSTFVEKSLNDKQNTLYQGESRLLDWATDTTDARKILFIDEANIGGRQWSEFEGLFNKPPGLLIDGKYYPLTNKHKVVFAGNPLNYGGERQLAPIFERHGNALLFEPMPQEFIYEAILKPIFTKTELEPEALKIALPLLQVYRFICESSLTEVRISARELQMMALLVLSYSRQNPKADFSGVAAHYAYQLGKNLVAEEHLAAFNKQFAPQNPLPIPDSPSKTPSIKSDFLLTDSRQAVRQQLDDLLTLRQVRREAMSNPAQQYGGLGGIVLEGEPGIGKSEIVMSTLIEHGYQEIFPHSSIIPEKAFYRMPVSMQAEDKKNLLLKAFDEGAIVVIDEINSSPMMERLLNDLLMGKTPEGKRPVKPGFLVIGTQNPVTMAGRQAPGNALARRLTKALLPTYSPQEMQAILVNKGVDYTAAIEMVAAYGKNVTLAMENNYTPAPTFRDLLRLAKRYILAHQKVELKTNAEQAVAKDDKQERAPPQLAIAEDYGTKQIQFKSVMQIMQIPPDNRDNNIQAILKLFDDPILHDSQALSLLATIKDIISNINPNDERDISANLLKIRKLSQNYDLKSEMNPYITPVLNSFIKNNNFKTIRETLSETPELGVIVGGELSSSRKVGS